jgi:hypothetical protein
MSWKKYFFFFESFCECHDQQDGTKILAAISRILEFVGADPFVDHAKHTPKFPVNPTIRDFDSFNATTYWLPISLQLPSSIVARNTMHHKLSTL